MESVFSGNAQITAAIEHMFGTISNPLLAIFNRYGTYGNYSEFHLLQ